MDKNEITYLIRGAVFEVNQVLGSGFLETVYEKAFPSRKKLYQVIPAKKASFKLNNHHLKMVG